MIESPNRKLSFAEVLQLWASWSSAYAAHQQGRLTAPELLAQKPLEVRGRRSLPVMALGSWLQLGGQILTRAALFLRLRFAVRLLVWARIGLDSIFPEPRSEVLNRSFTDLGVAEYRCGNLVAARQALDMAWRVYPSLLILQYGLSDRLVELLRDHDDADQEVQRYLKVADIVRRIMDSAR